MKQKKLDRYFADFARGRSSSEISEANAQKHAYARKVDETSPARVTTPFDKGL